MKKLVAIFWLWSANLFLLQASAPLGYYNSAEGRKAAALKTELHRILCQDTSQFLGYGSGAGKTWEGFYYTDRNRTTNAVIDMYSDSVRYFPNPNPNFVSFGQTIHIEHSMPKSWWGCDINHPDCAARDLNHLFPADGSANTSKNDNPLGEVTATPTLDNGVSKIGHASYDGYVGPVFEPADEYKGDFARAYFYMATMYEHYQYKWDISKPENIMEPNRYPVFKKWALDLLLQWHRQDPVSYKETTRNDVVYSIQNNRNPYIDYPNLVEYVWGNRTTIPFRMDGNVNFPYLKWPSMSDTLNVGKVYCFHAKDTVLHLQGMNISGDLTLALGGMDGSKFSLDKTTITAAEALSGISVGLRCNTVVVGQLSAILTISGGGISPVSVVLKAQSTDDFVALQPPTAGFTNFVAEWTASPGATGYLLDVYTTQPTGTYTATTVLEEDFPLSFPATWMREGYTEYASGTMRLGSGSNYGKITAPAIDLSTYTSTLTVRAKQYGSDAGAKLTALLDGNQVASWTTAVPNQDFVIELPMSTVLSKVALSAVAGKRVYVDYMKLQTHVPVYGQSPIAGFPLQVGNVLSYNVTGLQSGVTYNYKVTPQGNGAVTSNQITLQTKLNTQIQQAQLGVIKCLRTETGFYLSGLDGKSIVKVFFPDGKMASSLVANSAELIIPLSIHSIYFVQVFNEKTVFTFKLFW